MAPRAIWKGLLKVSLITIPVRLYNAVSSTAKLSLNQLHKDCHQRVRQQLACPQHGHIERCEVVKGYEYDKGRYVVIEQTDLDNIQLQTTRTIEIVQFAAADELDSIYCNAPYYVAPDGPVAEEAFCVLREAMNRSRRLAIGRLVLAGREHPLALRVEGKGLMLTTLRSAAEVRCCSAYFEDIQDHELPDEQLQLAAQLIESKTAPLQAAQFSDRYQEALLGVIQAKIAGSEPVVVQHSEAGQVINFMEALKQSVVEAGKTKATAKRRRPATRSRKAKSA